MRRSDVWRWDDAPWVCWSFCGRATWLDGYRVHIELPAPEAGGFESEEPEFREIVEAESIRYVYDPTSHSVTMYLRAGSVTRGWNEGLGALEGDMLHRDYLTTSTRGTSLSPSI